MERPTCSRPGHTPLSSLEAVPAISRELPNGSVIILAHNCKTGNRPCGEGKARLNRYKRYPMPRFSVHYRQKESIMGAMKLIEKQQRANSGARLGQTSLDGYEQRLIQWDCSSCRFFEKRVFRSGFPSEELDAYIICRFAGGVVDLIGEATACPKTCEAELIKNKIKTGRGRVRCGYVAPRTTAATGAPTSASSAPPPRLRNRPVRLALPQTEDTTRSVDTE